MSLAHCRDLLASADPDRLLATLSAPPKAQPGQVQEVAYKAGAMVRVSGPNIILSPPLVLTSADAETILAALDAGFAAL